MFLAALVAVGAVLVLVVRAPVQRTGLYALRGHRVFGVPRGAVRGIEVVMGGRRFSARRLDHGWEIDGRGANPGTGDALEDLVETVARLRAVDVFRPKDGTSYGLEQPRGTITVTTARAVRRLLLGDSNTAGSALYAHRGEDPRVIQVGTLLLSEIERVFYHRDRPEPPRARAPFPQSGLSFNKEPSLLRNGDEPFFSVRATVPVVEPSPLL